MKPECPSLESPSASSSPLQQLLFEPTVHPVSFVAKHLTEMTSRVPGKRKRRVNRRHVSYLIPREGLLTPRSTTLNHEVKCNSDQTSIDTYCLGLPKPKAAATEAEHFASTPDKLPWCPVVRSFGIADSVLSDKYLLKVLRRCGANVISGAVSERSATVALLDLSAQKRKSPEKLPDVSQKKQRVSWPTAVPSDVSHVAYRRGDSIGSNNSIVTSDSRVPSMSAVSLCDGRRACRSRSDPHSAPLSKTLAANYGSKSARRPHVSSWSADDVFAFVLSTPHASIYAKVSCDVNTFFFFFLSFISFPLLCGSITMIYASMQHGRILHQPTVDIILYFVQPYSLRSSSLPSRLYLHFHRPPSYAVFLSSHHMPIPLQHSFLDFLCDFHNFRCPSYSFISYLVQLRLILRTSIVALSFLRPPIYFPVPSSTPRTSVLVLPLFYTPSH